ncbi:MAG: phosphate signaling complex protein PhoU [Candidatus Aminicenantes bacterium]|nr:phosphate signaling complex protein PhoU [Candidatus Aminicenantes bacterium]
MLEQEVTSLKRKLIEYAALVEKMIDKSIKGLLNKDKNLFFEVRDKDEPRANDFEIELEDLCTVIIAKYQPAAKDLRTIMRVSQMNNDLERLADLAVNIVESGLILVEKPPLKPLIDIPHMARIASKMVKDSIDSFTNEDPILAKDVCKRDQTIDDLKDQVMRELITYMMSDVSSIERAFQLIRIANSLERIGDLATNICEDVIYIVEGKTIKHGKAE